MNTKQKIRLAAIAIAAVLLLVLLVQNRQEVSLNFLLASLTMPLALHLALVFCLGVVVGILLSFWLVGKRPTLPALKDGPTD
ncbi:MAG: LapA family protein [Tepidisphaerales bacterium]